MKNTIKFAKNIVHVSIAGAMFGMSVYCMKVSILALIGTTNKTIKDQLNNK